MMGFYLQVRKLYNLLNHNSAAFISHKIQPSKMHVWTVDDEILQAKMMLEKVKQTLEAANADLTNELKQVTAGRAESERRRKQVEVQLQEASVKLVEVEKSRGDAGDKASKLQVVSRVKQKPML